MRKFGLVGVTVLSMSAIVTPALARSAHRAPAKHQFTVGLVTDVGGINDKSFNYLAYIGLEHAQTKYKVRATFVQSNSETAYVPNLLHYAQTGTDLTIGVGFLMESAIYQVAKQYPQRKFALIDGAPTDAKGNVVNLPNVANLFFREQESGYLVGVLAGLMEKNHIGKARHNTIGYMGGLSIPPVNRYIAGYVAGARKVDPSIQIRRAYSNTFTNQGTGNQIGLQQISTGADILFQVAGASGLGYLAAAQQRGVYGIGVDSNQGRLGRHVITSALKKVDVAVQLVVRAARRGRLSGGDHVFNLGNNATGYAKPSSIVPASIIRQVNHYKKLIASGKIVPPTVIPQ